MKIRTLAIPTLLAGGVVATALLLAARLRRQSRPEEEHQKRTDYPEASESSQSTVVYVTAAGSRYHRAGCAGLRSQGKPVELAEAQTRLHLTPCKLCTPPA